MKRQDRYSRIVVSHLVMLTFLTMGSLAQAADKKSDKVPLDKATTPQPAPSKAGAGAAAKPTAESNNSGDKVDISDIESKYWAPKDTDFSVVQNRTYTKEKRFAASVQYGPLINSSFIEGYSLGVSANYFLSERYGVQVDYVMSDYEDSEATTRFKSLGGAPDYGKPTGYYGIGFNWIPFYAKMSVLGSKIIYFDMAITPTIGLTQYEAMTLDKGGLDKTGLSYGFDITQWFFLSSHFAIRADVKARWFQEEIVKYQTDAPVNSGDKLRDSWTDTTLFLLGCTFFF